MGKNALSSSSLHAGKQGREAGARRSSRARGLGARRQPGVGGKGGGRRGRAIPPVDLGDGGSQEVVRWRRVAANPGQCGGGTARHDGGPDPGKKKMGSSGIPVPTSARAAVLRDGGSAVACARGGGNGGSGARRSGRRLRSSGWGCGAEERRRGLYRRERRWRFGGMRRRPATELMAVGLAWFCAGVNGGRELTAMGHDASIRRRPLQAALCRSRRCCAASTAAGQRLDVVSRRAVRAHAGTRGQQAAGWARSRGQV